MKIFSIETSCDDTAVSVIDDFKILSNIVSSQVNIHKKWGGVYPSIAKREHKKNLITISKKALKESDLLEKKKKKEENIKKIKKIEKLLERDKDFLEEVLSFLGEYKKPNINTIAVTVGPGLEPCLYVGVNFAKALSIYWDIPIIPVNHIESHIVVSLFDLISKIKNFKKSKIKNIFPAVGLIISGGHTELILIKDINDYKIIGETRDDACGECFDKTARILGLSYPGGPFVEKFASKIKPNSKLKFSINLPRPMINSKDYDFSFSGLKTAVLYSYQKSNISDKRYKEEMAKEIQDSIIEVLIKKTFKAVNDFNAKTIIIGGGVSANKKLRNIFYKKTEEENINLLMPSIEFTGDNAFMIALAALLKGEKKDWKNIKVNANLRIKSSKGQRVNNKKA